MHLVQRKLGMNLSARPSKHNLYLLLKQDKELDVNNIVI